MEAACPNCRQMVRFGTTQRAQTQAVAWAEKLCKQSEAQRMLELLPRERFDRTHHSNLVECEFCLEDYKDGDELTRLPCMHIFHRTCIETWLATESVCPNCRLDFLDAIKMATGNAGSLSEAQGSDAAVTSVEHDSNVTAANVECGAGGAASGN